MVITAVIFVVSASFYKIPESSDFGWIHFSLLQNSHIAGLSFGLKETRKGKITVYNFISNMHYYDNCLIVWLKTHFTTFCHK